MNVYLDYNDKLYNRVVEKLSSFCKDNALIGKIKINLNNKTNIVKLIKQIEKTNVFSSIRFLIPINLVNVREIKKAFKQKIIVDIQILINQELTKNDLIKLKALSKIYRSIEVYDTSGKEQSESFVTYSNLIYINSKEGKDNIKFFYIICDNKKYGCMFSSCMGKTLNVDINGNVSFCPKCHELTYFCKIEELSMDKLYNAPKFKEVLLKAVNIRKKCINDNCEHIDICQGGCPIEDKSCERFKENYKKAYVFKKSLFDKKVNLSYQHLYVQENILWSVSRGKK